MPSLRVTSSIVTSQPGPEPVTEAMLEQLHAENERLRLRVLELMKLMEDEVTDKVEAEFRVDEWRHQAEALQRELDALRNTKVMRMMQPARRLYARIRRRG